MAEKSSAASIQREIVHGRGRITWTVGPRLLNDILAAGGASEAAELPESLLRELCHRSKIARINALFEKADRNQVGDAIIVVDQDSKGNDVEIRSAEVGFDVMLALLPEADEALELQFFDPQYVPVDFELRLFDVAPEMSDDPVHNIGSCLLSTTLYPPDLA